MYKVHKEITKFIQKMKVNTHIYMSMGCPMENGQWVRELPEGKRGRGETTCIAPPVVLCGKTKGPLSWGGVMPLHI